MVVRSVLVVSVVVLLGLLVGSGTALATDPDPWRCYYCVAGRPPGVVEVNVPIADDMYLSCCGGINGGNIKLDGVQVASCEDFSSCVYEFTGTRNEPHLVRFTMNDPVSSANVQGRNVYNPAVYQGSHWASYLQVFPSNWTSNMITDGVTDLLSTGTLAIFAAMFFGLMLAYHVIVAMNRIVRGMLRPEPTGLPGVPSENKQLGGVGYMDVGRPRGSRRGGDYGID